MRLASRFLPAKRMEWISRTWYPPFAPHPNPQTCRVAVPERRSQFAAATELTGQSGFWPRPIGAPPAVARDRAGEPARTPGAFAYTLA